MEFVVGGSDSRVSAEMLSFSVCETVSVVISVGTFSCFFLGLGTSMIESDLRCGGVGVSGVVGEVGFDPVGVVSSPFVHSPCFMIMGDGEPVVSEALAIKSSEECFVCEKSLGDPIMFKLDMPRPSIFATTAVSCRSTLSGSVAVAEGI